VSGRILVVGNYCHDTLLLRTGTFRTLGGSASYIGSALASVGDVAFDVVAKVGRDFLYSDRVPAPPRVVHGPTTHFVDDLRQPVRTERLEAVCEPILAADLDDVCADVGLACGVAMEILPEALRRLRDACRMVLADAQALLREAAPDGSVRLVPLSRTPFAECLDCLDVIKASAQEARFLDMELRGRVKVIVTEGPRGCRVVDGESERVVPTTAVEEVDSTGAGDCFMAGLTRALLRGMTLDEAAREGNRFGGLAVQQVGVPDFARLRGAA